jgi:hypothetical protein
MNLNTYIRVFEKENPPRQHVMIEFEVDQYVNLDAGVAFGLFSRHTAEMVLADIKVQKALDSMRLRRVRAIAALAIEDHLPPEQQLNVLKASEQSERDLIKALVTKVAS